MELENSSFSHWLPGCVYTHWMFCRFFYFIKLKISKDLYWENERGIRNCIYTRGDRTHKEKCWENLFRSNIIEKQLNETVHTTHTLIENLIKEDTKHEFPINVIFKNNFRLLYENWNLYNCWIVVNKDHFVMASETHSIPSFFFHRIVFEDTISLYVS